jgi:hypothetical protein
MDQTVNPETVEVQTVRSRFYQRLTSDEPLVPAPPLLCLAGFVDLEEHRPRRRSARWRTAAPPRNPIPRSPDCNSCQPNRILLAHRVRFC